MITLYYKSPLILQENSSCTKVQQLLLTQQRSVSMATLQIKSQLMNKMSTKHDLYTYWQFVFLYCSILHILYYMYYGTCFLNLLLENFQTLHTTLQTSAYRRGSYWSDSNWPNIGTNFFLKAEYMNDTLATKYISKSWQHIIPQPCSQAPLSFRHLQYPSGESLGMRLIIP